MKFSKAAFLDLESIHRGDMDLSSLESVVDEWLWFDEISHDDLLKVLPDVEVLVSNKVYLGEAELKLAKNLQLICIAATGTNNVDLDAARSRNISVCNVRAYATPSVVQHVFSLLLTLTTHQDQYRQAVQQGDWSRSKHFCLLDFPIRELRGKTLGIYGYGELGHAVAGVAEAFGMQVLIAKRNDSDTREGRVAMNELLSRVDVLSLHCPLNEDTRGLIGVQQIALMKNDAVLINAARGGLVDEAALLTAIQNNELGGAALDVLEHEPPEENHPLIAAGLPNLIVTPHIAWASTESRQRLIEQVAENISALAAGKPERLV